MDDVRIAREVTAVLGIAGHERAGAPRLRSLLGQLTAYPRKDAAAIADALATSLSEDEAREFLRLLLRQLAWV